MIEAIQQYVHPDTSMKQIKYVTFTAIIVDSMYGCEEGAITLDAMGYSFIMSCKATRPSYIFSQLHEKIQNCNDYSWVARRGKNNVLFAISLWNSTSKKKIVCTITFIVTIICTR